MGRKSAGIRAWYDETEKNGTSAIHFPMLPRKSSAWDLARGTALRTIPTTRTERGRKSESTRPERLQVKQRY